MVSISEYECQLFCHDLSRISPDGGESALDEFVRAIELKWPEIRRDFKEEKANWGLRPDFALLFYRANGQQIQLRVDLGPMPGVLWILISYYCENPLEVSETVIALVQWMMSAYGMEADPIWAYTDDPEVEFNSDMCYSDIPDATAVLRRFMNQNWQYWDQHPEILQYRLGEIAARKVKRALTVVDASETIESGPPAN